MSALQHPEMFADRTSTWRPGPDRSGFPALVPQAWTEVKSLRLTNLSPSEFIAWDEGEVDIGAIVSLDLPGLGRIRAQVMRREQSRVYGRFLHSDCLRLRFVNGLRCDKEGWPVRTARGA